MAGQGKLKKQEQGTQSTSAPVRFTLHCATNPSLLHRSAVCDASDLHSFLILPACQKLYRSEH